MKTCPYCKKDVGETALVNLVYTWEKLAKKNELMETAWHKKCYNAQQSVHLTAFGVCTLAFFAGFGICWLVFVR